MTHQIKFPEQSSLNTELKTFYQECINCWKNGPVNVGALLRFLVRGLDNNPEINANTDPGIRLVMGQIGYLLKLDGLGGFDDNNGKGISWETYLKLQSAIAEQKVEIL